MTGVGNPTVETAPGPISEEFEWEALTQEGLQAYVANRASEAAALWTRAAEASSSFPEIDPRRAASDNNQGVSYLLEGRFGDATVSFMRACNDWKNARHWVAHMKVSGTARSSLFHHRLELKYREQYKVHLRNRYRGWIDGGRSTTAFNRGLLSLAIGQDDKGRQLLGHAADLRKRCYGHADPELAVVLEALAGLAEREGRRQEAEEHAMWAEKARSDPSRDCLTRWREDRPAKMNDLRRLMAAVCLSAMLCERDVLPRPHSDRRKVRGSLTCRTSAPG